MSRNESRFAVVVTGLALVGLGSLPAVSGFVQRFRKREARQEVLYEDADGKATVESQRAYSAKVSKTVILLSAAAGLTFSIAIALLSTNQKTSLNDWLSTGAWGALLFQAITIASSRKSVQAFNLGIYSFLSSAVLGAILFVQGADASESLWNHNRTWFALRAIELALAGTLAVASLSIPRRPDVFINGEQVDRMFTVSALSRFTYAWPSKILDLAVKKKDLDLTDLNRPDHFCRAADTSADWKRRNYRHNLWLSVILAHKKAFALQWGLTLCTAFLNFSPQWVILQLLRILENPEVGTSYGFSVWYWVFFLGVAMIAQSWVEAYVFWLSWSDLAIPIRAQFSALIFEKSMRKKDVKGAGNAKEKEKATETGEPPVAGPTGEGAPSDAPPPEPVAEAEAEDENDSDELKKGKQNTVNLIGVDAKRVSDFSTYQNMFPGSLFKLIVSLTFLTNLLGWKALLAGFSAMLAIMPVNIHFSKKYAAAQDKLMKVRDEKMGVVTEALQGIRQIKFSALEPEWENKIGSVRDRELSAVWKVFMTDTALLACWVTSPILLSAISLAVYAALNGVLTPSVAFVSLGVFRGLEVTLSVIPELTTDLLDAWISIKRMQEYLDSPEVTVVSQDAEEVSFQDASIAWPSDDAINEEDRFVLRNISVTFPKGELSVISGKTGTGKSLMLSAILGEVDVLEGTLFVPRAPPLADRHDDKANKDNWIIPSAIAYVAQIPWIENATIKENVLFGLPFDEERYKKTIEVCALKKDLEMLTDGENTEIGQNGINLSGGQKWRITLARAIYSRAGILVLDDIFSAVDAHVGRHIFDKCLNGILATGRTRILVTHHVALCEPKTKYLVELGNGGVLEAGSVDKLRAAGALDQIKRHEESPEEIEADESAATAVNSDDSIDGDGEQAETDANALKKVNSKTAARKFVEDEGREKGAVKKQIYYQYLVASGGWSYWTVALIVFVVVQALNIGRSWWLKIWTGDYDKQAAHSLLSVSREQDFTYSTGMQQTSLHTMSAPSITSHNSLTYYLSIYVLLAFISSIVGTLKFLYIYIGSIRASRGLFRQLNFTILRAPIRWLDTVPVGRILNRFTSDFNIIDSQMANSVSFGVNSFLNLLGVIVAGLFVSPYIVLLAGFLLLICLYYAIRYLEGARPVKRLESTTKSPVFEQFGSALSGVATIRGFDKSEGYIKRMYRKVDEYSMATWYLWLFNRWMGWRMSLVGSFFASFVAILILITPGIDSALAGFALAFALEFSNCVMWTIRLYANVELNMNAAERIVEYASLPTESLEGSSPSAAWPTDGRIEFNDLVVSYAPDLPPVLKGLTFSVNRNERIGVVGRTGAGKSSLTLALFRFLEARSGSIHIDGIDISTIKLHDLRSRLAIIPQDPVLFSGTVRSNLDPFNHQTDAELRESLERVHLISDSASTSGTATPVPEGSTTGAIQNKNTNIFKNLDSQISEGGLNLSQGQRQLLCLARAIVSRPRIMVLDEATSAVDMHTDALIQRSIREEFTDATLLVIAHRLSTIADFDRILVLSDGKVAEFGTPRELWEKDGGSGVFRGMCEESGEKEKLKDTVYGK